MVKKRRHDTVQLTLLIRSHIVLITLTKVASSDRVNPPSCSRQLRSTFMLEQGNSTNNEPLILRYMAKNGLQRMGDSLVDQESFVKFDNSLSIPIYHLYPDP